MDLKNIQKAQTTLELAIFGSVVIFLIGLIVRTILGSSYQQDTRLKAFRMAMLTSFEYSEGIKAPPGNWQDGTASRNSATVFILEDRLTAQSAKYGAIDRTPQIATGSASHSRNLFMPVDPGEFANLPMTDFFVNGVHFPLTAASLRTYPLNQGVFKQQYNHPATDFCVCGGNVNSCFDVVGGTTYYRFDLDQNGILDDGVDNTNCDKFWWQWIAADPSQIDTESGAFTLVDVDGDGFTERVLGKNGNISVDVMDFQEGDLSFSPDTTRPSPGFSNQDVQMFTYSKNPLASGDGIGTYLLIDEGKLYEVSGDTRRYVRSAQRKDSIDIIQRTLQLSYDTRRFCDGTTVVQPGTILGNQAGWTASVANPVEVCCPDNLCCFNAANFTRTCMVTAGPGTLDPIIFVRSRIVDKHGRKWITPTDNDPNVQYLK